MADGQSAAAAREAVFEVSATWQLPDLAALVPPGGRLRDAAAHERVTHLDTVDGRLRRLGVSFERRETEEGSTWRLTLPHGAAHAGVQNHVGDETVPPEVSRQLEGVLAGAELVEVATVVTTSQIHQVANANDQTILAIGDRQNSGAAVGSDTTSATIAEWRQLVISPGSHADTETLRSARKLIKGAGARRASAGAAIDRVRDPRPVNDAVAHRKDTAASVGAYLARQCGQILLHDVSLRDRADVTAVHQMRVAIRRLRSVIKGFAAEVDGDAGDPVPVLGDLQWVAAQLGVIRDLDVLDRRVTAGVAALATGDVIGPVARHLTETLSVRRSRAYASWQLVWQDERYQRVMAVIAEWHQDPPTGLARSGKKALRKTRQRVDRALAAARDGAGTHPERWHDARKAAKRLRYVAEAVADGRPSAKKWAKWAKRLQQQLGLHHDALAAADFLHEQGRAAGARADDNGFSYGLLVADQRRLAADALATVPRRL